MVKFSVKRSSSDVHQERLINGGSLSELFQESKSFVLSKFISVSDDSWVDTILVESLSLFHHFSDEENIGGSSITDDIILGGGRSGDHLGSWVLDLHLMHEDGSILSQFDLSSTSNKHLQCSLWSQITFHNIHQTDSSMDIHS